MVLHFSMEGGLFSYEGASFLGGGCAPWRALVLVGGALKKIIGWGGTPPFPPPSPHYGKTVISNVNYVLKTENTKQKSMKINTVYDTFSV